MYERACMTKLLVAREAGVLRSRTMARNSTLKSHLNAKWQGITGQIGIRVMLHSCDRWGKVFLFLVEAGLKT